MVQNVSVAQSVIVSSLDFSGPRNRIVVPHLDFPTNHYVFEGWRRFGAEVVYVDSPDGLTQPADAWLPLIDERTALVCCSLVLFRSSSITDVAPILARARAVGAPVVLDVYQATGTLPLDLTALGVEFAVGGSVKWLCGGPGAGYLYVRPDVAATMAPAATGWAAHARPFAFETGPIAYAEGSERFASGTPNVSAWLIAQAGYRIVNEIGVPAIRAKSLRQTRRIIEHALARGWRVRTPPDDARRGGTVTLDVPDSARVAADLIARDVVIDHRPNAGIRMAPHFYTTDDEIDHALARAGRTRAGMDMDISKISESQAFARTRQPEGAWPQARAARVCKSLNCVSLLHEHEHAVLVGARDVEPAVAVHVTHDHLVAHA